jgi:hypothetical protein
VIHAYFPSTDTAATRFDVLLNQPQPPDGSIGKGGDQFSVTLCSSGPDAGRLPIPKSIGKGAAVNVNAKDLVMAFRSLADKIEEVQFHGTW